MENTGSHRYAGFWIRFLAAIIDGIILSTVGYLLFGNEVTQVSGAYIDVSFTGWKSLIPALYTILFWIWLSATPGKLVLGLKIVEANGKKLSIKTAIIRFFSYIVSSVALFLGFIWIGFDKEKQGWHDKIAKTHVVHK